ncbi:MAG: serine hydrolase [Tepidisphaeraceae bacterium]
MSTSEKPCFGRSARSIAASAYPKERSTRSVAGSRWCRPSRRRTSSTASWSPAPAQRARGPVRDLVAVYQSLLDHDERLLPAELSRQMIARQREGMFDETFKQTVDWGWGLKLDSKRYGKPETYGYGAHASDQTFGHSGNQCGCAFADPEHQLVVAWVVNGMPGEPKHQARQEAINTAIYEDLDLAGQ